jgi:protein-L-isoaspartate(D-aspartate) O-methyltransferase
VPSFPARLPSGLPKTGAKLNAPTDRTPAITPKTIANYVINTPASGKNGIKTLSQTYLGAPTAGAGSDSAALRSRMVHKLALGGVSDAAVLAAFNAVERHRFVDTALAAQAYEDTSLPIGLGQTISKPNVVARMLSLLREGCALDAKGKITGRVLEIGTGCAYQAALLCLLCEEVYSIERLRGLHEKARANVLGMGFIKLQLILGDGMLGYAKDAPYSGIIAAAGGEAIPRAWVDQLAVGGRIVAPIATSSREQSLMLLDKSSHGVKQTVLEGVLFVPLKSGVV